MMTDNNGALFPLSKNFLGTVKDPAWTVSNLCVVQLLRHMSHTKVKSMDCSAFLAYCMQG